MPYNKRLHQSYPWIVQELMKESVPIPIQLSKVSISAPPEDEALRCLWPFIAISRVTGMFPVTRQGNELIVHYRLYKPCWYPTMFGFCITLLLACNWMVGLILPINPGSIQNRQAWSGLIYYIRSVVNCLLIAWKVKDIPRLLTVFRRIEILCRDYQESEDNVVRNVTCSHIFMF